MENSEHTYHNLGSSKRVWNQQTSNLKGKKAENIISRKQEYVPINKKQVMLGNKSNG